MGGSRWELRVWYCAVIRAPRWEGDVPTTGISGPFASPEIVESTLKALGAPEPAAMAILFELTRDEIKIVKSWSTKNFPDTLRAERLAPDAIDNLGVAVAALDVVTFGKQSGWHRNDETVDLSNPTGDKCNVN